jgi:hypothetical protein
MNTTPSNTEFPRLSRAVTRLEQVSCEELGEATLLVMQIVGEKLIVGQSVPALDSLLTSAQLEAAKQELQATLTRWTNAIADLDKQWYDALTPQDADELCCLWLSRRSDLWAIETGFQSVGIHVDVSTFDQALGKHESTLATTVGFHWYENHVFPYRQARAVETLPWWLNEHLADVAQITVVDAEESLPPSDYVEIADKVRHFKANFHPSAAVAADTQQKLPSVRRLTWVSPDRSYIAILDIPETLTDQDWSNGFLPLQFFTPNRKPARELAGTPIKLGPVQSLKIDDLGEVAGTPQQWSENSDGRLYFGNDRVEWELEIPEVPGE